MPDYSKGKIYVIRSPNTEKVYIGSTVRCLKRRFRQHTDTRNCCRSGEIIKFGGAYIELLEDYACKTRVELESREQFWINHADYSEVCVNEKILEYSGGFVRYDYRRGKIYVIRSPHTNKVYIGSTIQELSARFSQHKTYRKCTSCEIIDSGDAYIELAENWPCNSQDELRVREKHWIQSEELCVNIRGNRACPHGRRHGRCKDCGGIGICEHDRQRSRCKECKGGQICEHDRRRSQCKECKGSQICEHDRQRSQCKECKGSQICEHDRVRPRCKICKGGSICDHNRLRSQCKTCSPAPCEVCEETYSKGNYKNHCKTKKHLQNKEKFLETSDPIPEGVEGEDYFFV